MLKQTLPVLSTSLILIALAAVFVTPAFADPPAVPSAAAFGSNQAAPSAVAATPSAAAAAPSAVASTPAPARATAAVASHAPVRDPLARPDGPMDLVAKGGILGGAGLFFTGFFVLVDSESRQHKLDAACESTSPTTHVCPSSYHSRIDSVRTEGKVGLYTSIAGIALIATGVILYNVSVRPAREQTVTLQIGPGSVRGAF